MADDEEVKESTPRGNEWEVVSLSASAYAAAPGPKELESNNRENDSEISRALFMSGHFVFPPSEHENLPIEPETSEIQDKHAGEEFLSDLDKEGSNIPEGFTDAQVFDGKGDLVEFEEETNLTSDKGQSMSTFHEVAAIDELFDPPEQSLDYPLDTEESSELDEEYKFDEDGLPCGAWWKRSAASLYTHAKDSNSFWSIFVAATVLGLVIIGQRFQQERWQALQVKWHLNVSSEKMGKMLGPLSRLKDVIVGAHGHRQGSLIKYGSET